MSNKPLAAIRALSTIPRETVTWFWRHRIPIGKITVVAGDPGVSKSLVSIDLAARASVGWEFPDGAEPFPGDTIIMTPEDDPADTIRPRLEVAGGNPARVHFLDGRLVAKDGNLSVGSISLLDIGVMADALAQIRAGGGNPVLFIVDPLDSYLGANADANSNDVRTVLSPVAEFAAREKIAVLGIKHLNKASGNSAAYRVTGSIGFTAVARAVWTISKDPEDPAKRLFLCLKNNLAQDNNGLSYRVIPDAFDIPHLQWDRAPETRTANEVLQAFRPGGGNRRTSTERDRIVLFLEDRDEASTAEIAAAIGSSKSSASNMLRKLVDDGAIENHRYGKYRVSSYNPTQKTDVTDETSETIPNHSAGSSDSSLFGDPEPMNPDADDAVPFVRENEDGTRSVNMAGLMEIAREQADARQFIENKDEEELDELEIF